ncbi:hypothetical protein LP414_32080 [Polaromonas sp. P1(28)-13]|nr:hypothetical protein LP414_32080 [Polaromonas sp. P1(28)-13]
MQQRLRFAESTAHANQLQQLTGIFPDPRVRIEHMALQPHLSPLSTKTSMNKQFENQVVLITGATAGIATLRLLRSHVREPISS